MKMFKLKYFVLVVIIVTQWSCAVNDDIKDSNTAATNSKSFVFEEGIDHYIIDGQITNDRQIIVQAAKNAWNIHFDYPVNKAVISTTPDEFEKYKNSNLEFKKAFEHSDNVSTSDFSKSTFDFLATTVTIPSGEWDLYTEASRSSSRDSNIFVRYNNNSRGKSSKLLIGQVQNSDSDMSTFSNHQYNYDAFVTITTLDDPIIYKFSDLSEIIANDYKFPTVILSLSNTSANNLVKTFYKNTSMGGTGISVTVGSGNVNRITNVELSDPESYK